MSISKTSRLFLAAAILILTACSATADPAKVEVRRAEVAPADGLTPVSLRAGEPNTMYDTVYVYDTVELTDADFATAALGQDNLGRPAVVITLTDAAAARFETMTSAHLQKPLAIMVHGELVAAPIIVSPLSRAMMITGLSDEETRALVDDLAQDAI